jgi:hypothetical protein
MNDQSGHVEVNVKGRDRLRYKIIENEQNESAEKNLSTFTIYDIVRSKIKETNVDKFIGILERFVKRFEDNILSCKNNLTQN